MCGSRQRASGCDATAARRPGSPGASGSWSARKPRTCRGTPIAMASADDPEVRRDRDVQRDHRGADERAGDAADAVAGVEARHDRAPEPPLDGRRLDVHRDVPGAPGEAEGEQADHDRQHADQVAEGDRRDAGADDDRHHLDRAARAEAVDDRAGERQRQQRARGDREQHEAERGRAQVQVVAHLRDPRGPAREREAGCDERDRGRADRATRLLDQCAPSARRSTPRRPRARAARATTPTLSRASAITRFSASACGRPSCCASRSARPITRTSRGGEVDARSSDRPGRDRARPCSRRGA